MLKNDWFIKPQVQVIEYYYRLYKAGLNFGLHDKFEAELTFDVPSYHLGYNAGIYVSKMIGVFTSLNHSLITDTKHFELMLQLKI
ncbi:hypothetical protein [Aquimarina macrocephali]|uniref:hypothetical protein n=1 Tax=Aquimarina macrocephali TaxID=666563 RepID=UPI000465C057|nr:hypothetical protein [Aquimarina macrocephali]